MYAGGIYSMYFFQAGYFLRNSCARYFMYKLAKAGILLRRPAYYGKWPYGIVACIDLVYPHQREIMRQTIITQVIAKRPLRFIFIGIYFPCNYKISIGADGIAIFITIPEPPATKHTRKSHFAYTFRQRHN